MNECLKNLSREQQQKLFKENEKLVVHIAKKYYCPEDMREDMLQCGYIGLWRGIKELDNFDPNKSKVSTWFGWYIMKEFSNFSYKAANKSGLSAGPYVMKRAIKQNHNATKSEEDKRLFTHASSLTITDGENELFERSDVGTHDDYEDVYSDDTRRAIEDALSTLPEMQRRAVKLLYGIGGEPCSFNKTASELRISNERVRQLNRLALVRLRHPRNSRQLAELL